MATTWIDAHLDLAYLAVAGRDLTLPLPPEAPGCISLPALRAANVDLVLATIFTEPGVDPATEASGYRDADEAHRAGRRQLDVYRDLEERGEISIVRRRDDLDALGDRPGVVLLMEGADPIRDASDAATWWEAGVRAVGLTWSRGTRYAGGNARHGPLTDMGRDLVDALDEVGMIHDASHLADAALEELLARSDGPVVATHSNCRALVRDAQRHLRDDHIARIAERGGVVGLNLFGKFITVARRPRVDDALRHVERVADVMGHRHGVGLGSDMDGGFDRSGLPEDLDHPEHLERLTEGLAVRGWSEADVGGFRSGNWRRFLEGALPA